MSETENNTQGQRPKTSLLAIASISIPVIALLERYLVVFCVENKYSGLFPFLLGMLLIPLAFSVLVGPVLGILAFIEIRWSAKLKKGYIIAVLGVLMFFPAFYRGPMVALVRIREEAVIISCRRQMIQLGDAMRFYSTDHNNQYPAVNQWCDLLLEYIDLHDTWFFCVDGDEMNHYALNPNVRPNSPSDVVLLFETELGWNQFGGPELLTATHHKGFGCNILFNDGHVEFIKPRRFGKLKWKDNQKQ